MLGIVRESQRQDKDANKNLSRFYCQITFFFLPFLCFIHSFITFLESISLLLLIMADIFWRSAYNMSGTILSALYMINISLNLQSNIMKLVFLSSPLYRGNVSLHQLSLPSSLPVSSASIHPSNYLFIQQIDIQVVVLDSGNKMVNEIRKLSSLKVYSLA